MVKIVPSSRLFPVLAGINSPSSPPPSLVTSYNIPFRNAIVAIFRAKLASPPKSNSSLRVSPFPRVSIPPSSPSPSLPTSYNIPFCDAIVAIFGAKLASQTISIVVSFSASFLLKIAQQ